MKDKKTLIGVVVFLCVIIPFAGVLIYTTQEREGRSIMHKVNITPVAEAAAEAFKKPFGKRTIKLTYINLVQHHWRWTAICPYTKNVTASANGYNTKSGAKAAAKREYQGWELEFVEE